MPTWQETYAGYNVDQRIAFFQFTNRRPPTAAEVASIIREFAGQHFGALAVYLDIPEVGPLLTQAAQQGWSLAKLNQELTNTAWWKSTTAPQRQWDALVASDSATAGQQVTEMAAKVSEFLSQQGLEGRVSQERITELATTIMRSGGQADAIPKFALAEIEYSPTQSAGRLGARETQVKQVAFEYGLPLDDQSAFDIAKKVETGQMTAEGIQDLFKIQAKAAFGTDPNLAAQIDAGFTLRQILAPQTSTIAQLLGVAAETIDYRDSRWSGIVSFDPGNGQTRVANASETAKLVRQSDEYWQTSNAEAEAAKFVQDLGRQFGKVA